MKTLTLFAAGLLLLGLAGRCAADDKKDELKKDDTAAKFAGDWEVTKADNAELVGASVTFAKDGKLSIAIKIGGTEMKIEGTYKIEKGKLITEVKVGEETHSDTDTVKKLTADEMELEDTKGQVTVLKRKAKK